MNASNNSFCRRSTIIIPWAKRYSIAYAVTKYLTNYATKNIRIFIFKI